MTSFATDIEIVAAICARLSVEPIQSLDEDSLAGQQVAQIYYPLVDFCLGLAPWSFARRTRQLVLAPGVVSNLGFAYVHTLPAERIGPPERLIADVTRPDMTIQAFDYDEEGRVHSDYDPLYAQITIRPLPIGWAPMFREAVIAAGAAALAEALTGNSSLKSDLHAEAFGTPSEKFRGGKMGAALSADSRNTPARRLPSNNPLLAAWGAG